MTERKISQLAGKVLAGRYELVKVIGDGGMGRVYRGVQLSTGGRVAIKIMDAWDHDASTVKRFRYEAETTASLSHPNTVRILDFGSDDDLFFLVMEYLPGTDLTRYLRREGQSDPFVAHVLLQTACSLAEAHSRGVVHRDIKPNNIMLLHHAGLPSFVKVIDFGIARAIGGPGNGTVGVLGTMGYIAPEQMKDGVQLDARTDLYSLGCVAYELLSGRLPFDGITHNSPPMDVLEAHLRGNPTPLHEAKPGVHPGLADLIMSMIRKRPDDRPPAAGELIEPLYELRRDLSPELASSYENSSSSTSSSRSAAEEPEPPPAQQEGIEIPDSRPPGTAAYESPAMLMEVADPSSLERSSPPEPLAAPPAKTPTGGLPFSTMDEDDEDDEDVMSSAAPIRRSSKPPLANVEPEARPEGEDIATAGKTVKVDPPPMMGHTSEPAAPEPPPAEPETPDAPEAPADDAQWAFAEEERPPTTGRIARPETPQPRPGGQAVSVILGIAIGMVLMYFLRG